MDCSTHNSRGQAVLELTFVAALVLLVVTCSVALIATVKKEMKHDFLRAQDENSNGSHTPVSTDMALDFKKLGVGVGQNLVFFGKEPLSKVVDKITDEGWKEDKRLKAPEGLLIFFSREDRKMSLIKSKSGLLGVFP